jgi:predicted permease
MAARSSWWARVLLRSLAARGEAEDVLGDLEEAHLRRTRRHGRLAARALTTTETLDMAAALVRARIIRWQISKGNGIMQDYKLGFRMLVKYPGLTLAGGLALAIAIGLGAGWYDVMSDVLHPRMPFADGDRFVEIQTRNAATSRREYRVLHDFAAWRRDARSLEELGAYRTVERNLVGGDVQSGPVAVAEMTASAFRLVGVPPLHGRPLLDPDERPGAPPVVVLGYDMWRQRFGGRPDAIGQSMQLGNTAMTVVGIMPDGFAFPVNHRMWIPLRLRAEGYAPLEGTHVSVFGRLAPGATFAQANAEIKALTERTAAASPQTHQHLRPVVMAYAAEYDQDWINVSLTHLPIILVLIVACTTVGTLVYARTATRDAEIATRYALGASRRRIIGQLFIEALVLSSVAAVVGLGVANWVLKWGFNVYLAGDFEPPFWMEPGLKLRTVLYAAVLTTAGAAMVGILPAVKATGSHVQAQLRNLGAGGSTLQFGWVWTAAMFFQITVTVLCIPVAMEIAGETVRDRGIRSQFPAEQYLAARVAMDREPASGPESDEAAFRGRLEQTYRELERRVAQEPGVVAVMFGNRMPGMSPVVRNAEIETAAGAPPRFVANMWTSAVGPGYFEAFDKKIVAGRPFHDGDRAETATTALVNEAFARRYGANPIGRRARFVTDDAASPEPWLEIVGIVQDEGMTPTDLGEAPYVYRAVSAATVSPMVMGVRTNGNAASFGPRLRAVAAGVDPALRIDEMRTLEDFVLREETPNLIFTGSGAAVVALGLLLSAAGIFSLMSVTVARRTREIGLRSALGASPRRLIAAVFKRALMLIGSGVAAGNAVIILAAILSAELSLRNIAGALLIASAVMLTVGLLACAGPARRALRIQPADALKVT